MSKNNQQKKETAQPAEPQKAPEAAPLTAQTPPIQDAAEPDKQAATTMKIKPDTKARLEDLKGVMKLTDLDAVVGRLIDTLPKRLSTEDQVHLVLPVSKYRWLMAHQDTCDCRTCLNEAKV
jgi:hypothetical protein